MHLYNILLLSATQVGRCFQQMFHHVTYRRSLLAISHTYRFKRFLVPVGVDRWQKMDSGLFHQVTYPRVARQILQTHELHQQKEQFSSQHLIAMGTCCVTKLRFTWSQVHTEGQMSGRQINMHSHLLRVQLNQEKHSLLSFIVVLYTQQLLH